jgi:[acyl-carrier-protein] S-malonyltransferase
MTMPCARCAEAAAGEVVEAVNLNSPGQVVIAGNKAQSNAPWCYEGRRCARRCRFVPSHFALMLPAAGCWRICRRRL